MALWAHGGPIGRRGGRTRRHHRLSGVRRLAADLGPVCGGIALDDGDDALQETLLLVLRSLDQLRDPAAVVGWARRIAVREAVRVARPDVEVFVYPGAGHGFGCDERGSHSAEDAALARRRTLEFFGRHLG